MVGPVLSESTLTLSGTHRPPHSPEERSNKQQRGPGRWTLQVAEPSDRVTKGSQAWGDSAAPTAT